MTSAIQNTMRHASPSPLLYVYAGNAMATKSASFATRFRISPMIDPLNNPPKVKVNAATIKATNAQNFTRSRFA